MFAAIVREYVRMPQRKVGQDKAGAQQNDYACEGRDTLEALTDLMSISPSHAFIYVPTSAEARNVPSILVSSSRCWVERLAWATKSMDMEEKALSCQ
jgi:hypothetical protein